MCLLCLLWLSPNSFPQQHDGASGVYKVRILGTERYLSPGVEEVFASREAGIDDPIPAESLFKWGNLDTLKPGIGVQHDKEKVGAERGFAFAAIQAIA